jgi:hypothetical protein
MSEELQDATAGTPHPDGAVAPSGVPVVSPVQALGHAVDRLLAEDPVELDGATALDRARVLLMSQERLRAATLIAVRDVDCRELYALDACGSTRSWLRTQLGGDQGQLELARRLGKRPQIATALADGVVSGRIAGQLCTALEKVPGEVTEPVMVAVVTDGLADLLRAQVGADEDGEAPSDAALAVRADLAAVQASTLAASALAPAARLEPCLLLLARHLPPAELTNATDRLLDALQPEQLPVPDDAAEFYLQLTQVLDGAWDLRGLLDPETGTLLSRVLDRHEAAMKRAEKKASEHAESDGEAGQAGQAEQDAETGPDEGTGQAEQVQPAELDRQAEPDGHTQLGQRGGEPDDRQPTTPDAPPNTTSSASTPDAPPNTTSGAPTPDAPPGPDDEPDEPDDGPLDQEAWLDLFTRTLTDHDPHASRPRWAPTAGRRRHDALRQLLRDSAQHDTGSGRPTPAALTIVCTLDALEGRPGALPGTLQTTRLPVSLRPETIRRLGCDSELTAVLLDATGNPIGASGTHRTATKREREALRVRWGPTCAIAGCTRTTTTPHHVVPWWLSQQTVLKDLVPICTPDHRDLHEDHRTLRLKDGRLIDELGWVTPGTVAA